jgi:hypothetical protein
MGPFSISGGTTWDKFLSLVVETVRLPQESKLAGDSMQWRWKHEKQTLPLTSKSGFELMVKQICTSKLGDTGLLIVTMEKPLLKCGDGELPVSACNFYPKSSMSDIVHSPGNHAVTKPRKTRRIDLMGKTRTQQ